jgi:hypothetical protein
MMTWFDRLRSSIGWGTADLAVVAEVRQGLNSDLDGMVQNLCQKLAEFKDAQQLMANPRYARRLHDVLHEWLAGLLEGTFDEEYTKARWSLVQRLIDTDLEFSDLILLGNLARELLLELARSLAKPSEALWDVINTLERALCLDLALILNGYIHIREDEMERAMLDRFLSITGFSRTLYENLAEAREWSDVSLQRSDL